MDDVTDGATVQAKAKQLCYQKPALAEQVFGAMAEVLRESLAGALKLLADRMDAWALAAQRQQGQTAVLSGLPKPRKRIWPWSRKEPERIVPDRSEASARLERGSTGEPPPRLEPLSSAVAPQDRLKFLARNARRKASRCESGPVGMDVIHGGLDQILIYLPADTEGRLSL